VIADGHASDATVGQLRVAPCDQAGAKLVLNPSGGSTRTLKTVAGEWQALSETALVISRLSRGTSGWTLVLKAAGAAAAEESAWRRASTARRHRASWTGRRRSVRARRASRTATTQTWGQDASGCHRASRQVLARLPTTGGRPYATRIARLDQSTRAAPPH
jgi:hypothetical protein